MDSLTLNFADEASCRAFCRWYEQFLGGARVERVGPACCIHVTFRRQLLRTVMTVARYNHAEIEAA